MALAASHAPLPGQEVSRQALPPRSPQVTYPDAVVIPAESDTVHTVLQSNTQTEQNGHFVLDGEVEITYGDRMIRADHIEYDNATSELTATGHLVATGGANDERITASHGTMNLKQQTGRFYDVSGSVGMKLNPKLGGSRVVYTSGEPFLFTGRVVVRTSANHYQVYDGTVTSCRLPKPDWLLSAGLFEIDGEKARARNSIFHLLGLPVLYLPYVTHPVDAEARQSGLLLPVISQSSIKGFVTGEEVYWAINRSTDMTVGVQYYSLRGWEETTSFRYRGRGLNFFNAHYNGLQDRGYTPTGGVYTNQGGEDVVLSGRYDLSPQTRFVGDAEYLSSYPYREAFSNSFNQAVSSDILSSAYAIRETGGYMASVRADRYQGLKRQALLATPTTPASPEQQVRIFHAPSLDLDTTEHRIPGTPLLWELESSTAALKRVQSNFVTGGEIERFDLHPRFSLPVAGVNGHLLATAGVRETLYSRNRLAPSGLAGPPVEGTGGLSRSDFEAELNLRPPVLERTFDQGFLPKLFGRDVRHTIEPELTYRYVTGIGNFANVLRFDDKDVVSNTNELEYGVTQRLFARPRPGNACSETPPPVLSALEERDDLASATCATSERLRWRLTQKYFFDPTFGGAVTPGRRNILATTLSFSGIAFLTEPREISPLLSRLRFQTSEQTDLEWDFDFDTGAKKFTSDNIFFDIHQGKTFGGLSYARLNAPGRFYTEGVSSAVSDFNQLRVLLGYGSLTKPGPAVAANAGIDLNLGSVQYASLQTSYNWNCCGVTIEYRKYELGASRNENVYRFNFTLANIGTAGNLRRAERLF